MVKTHNTKNIVFGYIYALCSISFELSYEDNR